MTQPLLAIRDLSVAFGTVQALDRVSLDIDPATRIGLVGESGSGKSTLGLAILGLLPHSARVTGQVRFEGGTLPWADDTAMTRLRGHGIGFVYQDPMSAYSPVHSIGTHLMRAIRASRPELSSADARARAIRLMEEVEIARAAERLDHYPHEYSGGMRQRVMIAAALAGDPRLLIADEPTTALDVTTQAAVLALFDRIVTERRMAFVLVTHDLGVVAEACAEAAVLYGGRLMHRAPIARLKDGPVHPYTRALLDARPTFGHRGQRLATIPAAEAGAPPHRGCPFEPRCWRGKGEALCKTERPEPRRLTSGDLAACHYPVAPGAEPTHA